MEYMATQLAIEFFFFICLIPDGDALIHGYGALINRLIFDRDQSWNMVNRVSCIPYIYSYVSNSLDT